MQKSFGNFSYARCCWAEGYVKKGNLLGYVFNGILYKSREDAYKEYYNYIKIPEGVDAITRETILEPQAKYEEKHSFINPTIF